jgi:ubiquinone/menaquinone biosynthesis C-methylase UbiE
MAQTWVDFWNGGTTIYANDRHLAVHYETVANDIVALVGNPGGVVIDFGCGAALSADKVAAAVRHLWLVDAAPTVRADLAQRFRTVANISVASPERLALVADATVDAIVANSVVQYLSKDEFRSALRLWRRLLKPAGTLVVADVLPPNQSAVKDAAALLSFGAKHGFLAPAARGLVRTALSDYRSIRSRLGLTTYTPDAMLDAFAEEGFTATRLPKNIGHNQARMTFQARRSR